MDIEALAIIGVPDTALTFRAVRSSGPGGQNVNKVSTAVQLQCDLNQCVLNDDSKARLRTVAGRRLSSDDVVTIVAQRLRTQEQNKRDAMERLYELISQALIAPKPRRATKPSKAAKRRRLDTKVQRGQTKQLRRRVTLE